VLAMAALPLVAGCRSWQATPIAPATLIADEGPTEIRVTFADERVVTIERPSIVSDSIRGLTREGTVRAAIDDVRSLEVRRSSFPKSLAFVVFHVAAVVSFIAIIVDLQPHYRGF
jgi:hypothetical protein